MNELNTNIITKEMVQEVRKNLKRELKTTFPNVKFSLTSNELCFINVSHNENLKLEGIEAIAKKYIYWYIDSIYINNVLAACQWN